MPGLSVPSPCFAVAGSPILGSLSALLYRALFARVGLRAHYTRISIDRADQLLTLAEELGLSGMNITSPLKQATLSRLARCSDETREVGATNTILAAPGGWMAHNTDVAGVTHTLARAGVSPDTHRVLVLGAGGAARAVLTALRQAGFRRVRLCNRSPDRAAELERATGVPSCGLGELETALAGSDLLISCIPGDPGLIPAAWLRPGMAVLDADYRARGLTRAAELAGCRILLGSDWLAWQAVASFELFTGHRLDPAHQDWLRALVASPPTPSPGPVVLTGFSGTGKSAVGAILARLLGWAFVDTDREVEREAGTTIPRIFEGEGEPGFRQRERQVVARALGLPRAVIALGGGALLHPDTRSQLEDHGLCVLLHADLEHCAERAGDGTRPLLSGARSLGALWEQRRPGYLACADLVLSSHHQSAEATARQLMRELELGGQLERPSAARSLGPGRVRGALLQCPASKSHGIRALCAASLAKGTSTLRNPPRCEDFAVAVGICEALGARVEHRAGALEVHGIGGRCSAPEGTVLDCGESALCMRLFACIAAALGGRFRLEAHGSLLRRPMAALEHALRDLGIRCSSRDSLPPLGVQGPPTRSRVLLDASGSSQVLSGLLMAAPLAGRPTLIRARGLVSRPYVALTLDLLAHAGICYEASSDLDRFELPALQGYRPLDLGIQSDWSALAFLLVAGATTGSIELHRVDLGTSQGDEVILEVLRSAGAPPRIDDELLSVATGTLRPFDFDATDHPDLFPPLAVLAAACPGASELRGVGRLHHKESDRALALQRELGAMGVRIELEGDLMRVHGGPVHAADVDAHGDHRIAMALAVAALRADAPCTLTGAAHVAKSYPRFFHDLNVLCGAQP